MPELKWGPNLQLGVPSMDEQHQQLIAAMQEVQRLDGARAPVEQIGRALEELVRLTRAHFADEEAFMASIGYADRHRHAAIHVDLVHTLDDYVAQFRGGNGRLPDGFVRFLVYWLAAHIQGIDRKYAAIVVAQPQPTGSR